MILLYARAEGVNALFSLRAHQGVNSLHLYKQIFQVLLKLC